MQFTNGRVWGGIDWSSTGKDETILTIINNEGQIKQYCIEGSLDYKYKRIAEICKGLQLVGGYAETNSIGDVMLNELRKYTTLFRGFTTTNESKTEIITELALALENGELEYDSLELDRQLGAFGYSLTKTKKLSFQGKNEHDDRCMSLAMALKAKKDMIGYNKSNFTFI